MGEEVHTLVIENQTQAEAATRPLGSCTEGTSNGIAVGNISGMDLCYTEGPEDGNLPCEEAPAEEYKGTCARIEDLSEVKRKDRFKGKCDARGDLASLVVEQSAKKKNRKKFGSLGVKGKQGRTKSSSVKVHYCGWKVLIVVLYTQIIALTTDWRRGGGSLERRGSVATWSDPRAPWESSFRGLYNFQYVAHE